VEDGRVTPRTPDQDPSLKAGLDLLVDDMVATSDISRQRATDRVYRVAQARIDYLHSDDFEEPVSHTVVQVAEDVQEDMIEGSGDLTRLAVWPRCPDHPNHPLWLLPELAPDAAWTCRTSGRVVAQLGGLSEAAR
jgi:hypothetical protein